MSVLILYQPTTTTAQYNCTRPDYPCKQNSDCCSGSCSLERGKETGTCSCASSLDSCRGDNTLCCDRYLCDVDQCVDTLGVCHADGDMDFTSPCKYNTDCCSLDCTNGKCQCSLPGYKCREDIDCCRLDLPKRRYCDKYQRCNYTYDDSILCSLGISGTNCTINADCCGSNCRDGECQCSDLGKPCYGESRECCGETVCDSLTNLCVPKLPI